MFTSVTVLQLHAFGQLLACLSYGFNVDHPIGNIALGKPASQLQTLDYNGFLWDASFAVDGCTNGTLPDVSMCCSSSESVPGFTNFWRVDLGREYGIMRIILFGRSGEVGYSNGKPFYTKPILSSL